MRIDLNTLTGEQRRAFVATMTDALGLREPDCWCDHCNEPIFDREHAISDGHYTCCCDPCLDEVRDAEWAAAEDYRNAGIGWDYVD